jgi:hypothetical protein
METLLSEIDAFCRAHGISESQFGKLALNDKPFVKQLRNGRRVWPETADRVRAFMVTYRRKEAA